MTNDAFYFFQVDRELPIRDYERINESLRRQGASFRYGPAFDEQEQPPWMEDFDCNLSGIYRRKEDFNNPLEARITLAEAYQRERIFRLNHPIFSPKEPRLPEE